MIDELFYKLNCMIRAILIGWGSVFYTTYTWTELMADYTIKRHFWKSMTWNEFSGLGWYYLYRYNV